MTPLPYQITGAEFLIRRKRALLADEMGLGKSAQAIMACDAVGASQVLVLCPASVRENWRREFKKFGMRDIVPRVMSYDAVVRDLGMLREIPHWDVLIADEAHMLKNHKAKRTQAVFGPRCDGLGGLVERAERVFLLTGTPAPNHPAELWPMLRTCAPELIYGVNHQPLSYWSFVRKYCKTRDNGFGIQIVGGRNLEQLKARMSPFVLRRKKAEVLKELPPIRFDELAVQTTTAHGFKMVDLTEQEQAIRKALAEHGVAGLREIAAHVAQLRRVTAMAKVPGVVEWIKDQFEGGLDKLVVFAWHREVIGALQSAFSFHISIAGDTPTGSRAGIVDCFQQNPAAKLFIGQIQAAGTGITLTAASDVLFVESSWTPADNEQAAMRVHRIGQRNACLIRFATLAGSIDEQIQRALMRKTETIRQLFQ